MKLLRGHQKSSYFPAGAVATIGNFDGVHLGHQQLIKTLREKADAMKLPLVLVLFEPQPREYFLKDKAPARLSTLREKIEALKSSKVDYVYCIKFDKHIAQTSANDFVKKQLFEQFNIKYLLIGEDFRFGKNREGDTGLLKEMGHLFHCKVETFADFTIDHEKVSSTKIRAALLEGHFSTAQQLLGRPYSMCGRVVKGDGRGRQWGIPTANLCINRLSLPLFGVYAVKVTVHSQVIYGVANIGSRPTIDGTKNILEVHLFDFNDSIYGEMLKVVFLHKLRDEEKFSSVEALIEQIQNDIKTAKTYLQENCRYDVNKAMSYDFIDLVE
ncbi:bifunctional riboflavin kinase/FAD synthetase [Legionella waltersii]|uniref:Riboflavin biosynthesis protein n=1 Tax=Legionella waltersii TaxID=66969 RepID=A0A0W1ANL9_9GAMM|nr:bifunctional riboflavin kinase/FAD synthetase [Legionella waltersii]KTD82929.1 riboflavin biosynthesis protein RibF (riboflavin kinase/FMN adenylyltransferase) [Legionella waltersii]SNV02356.1 riboflavin kinase [Legionella waltersii]